MRIGPDGSLYVGQKREWELVELGASFPVDGPFSDTEIDLSHLGPVGAETWPYNLFAMVHGRSTDEAVGRVERVHELIEDHRGSVDTAILNSARILKKTGLRLSE